MKHFLIKFIVDVALTWMLNGSLYNSKCPFMTFSVMTLQVVKCKVCVITTTICIMYVCCTIWNTFKGPESEHSTIVLQAAHKYSGIIYRDLRAGLF